MEVCGINKFYYISICQKKQLEYVILKCTIYNNNYSNNNNNKIGQPGRNLTEDV